MPELSGIDTLEVDEGATGTYDYTFSDIHEDAEVTTENFDNDQDVRGDTYYTGSFIELEMVLPDLEDDSGTNRESDLVALMTGGDYHQLRLTKQNGDTIVLTQTRVRVSQDTNSSVGTLDPWRIMAREVDTSGPFYWS